MMSKPPGHRLSLPALCIALLVAGCAANEPADDAASTSSDDCFHIRQITNWDAIDDRHIYLEEIGDDHYLLTMFGSCPGIRFSQVIALSNHMGRVCPNDFGTIIYRDAGRRSSCRIDNVERVSAKDEATAIVESRRAEKETEK